VDEVRSESEVHALLRSFNEVKQNDSSVRNEKERMRKLSTWLNVVDIQKKGVEFQSYPTMAFAKEANVVAHPTWVPKSTSS